MVIASPRSGTATRDAKARSTSFLKRASRFASTFRRPPTRARAFAIPIAAPTLLFSTGGPDYRASACLLPSASLRQHRWVADPTRRAPSARCEFERPDLR